MHAWQVFPVSEEAPAVVAVIAPGLRTSRFAHIEPVDLSPSGRITRSPRDPMFGGNFAGTCDSRFNEVIERFINYGPGVLKVHDRFE